MAAPVRRVRVEISEDTRGRDMERWSGMMEETRVRESTGLVWYTTVRSDRNENER